MAKPLVSVIVPVYNAQKTVPAALDSLLKQTQTAFEIICVNDASTDRSAAVLAAFARKDKRIRVITQSHQGAGAARNKGLSKARGTYVFFMDADDVVVPSFLAQVVDFALKRKAQITLFDGGVLTDGHQLMKRSSSEFLARLDPVFSLKSLTPADRDDFYLETPLVPWNKLFERRFLIQNHIEFGTTQTSEDIYFNLVALGLADAVAYLPETYYYYRADQKKSLSRRRVVDLPAACIAVEAAEKRLLPVFSDLSYALKRYELFQYVTWIRRYIGCPSVRSFYQTVQNKLIDAQKKDVRRLYRALDKPYFDVVRLRSYEEALYQTDGFALNPPKGLVFSVCRKMVFLRQKVRQSADSLNRVRMLFSLKEFIQPIAPLKPNAVTIVFAVDAPYVAPLSVTVQSVLDHADPNTFYDLVVLEKEIAPQDKTTLIDQVRAYPNCSLRFWNMASLTERIGESLFYESAHISKTSYYRLFIPLIFKAYDRVLYLDGDLIFRQDAAELFHYPLSGNVIGAVRDFKLIKDVYNPCHFGFNTIYPYLKQALHLKNEQDYVNSGVLVMDTRRLREMDFVGKALLTLGRLKEPMYHDQDVMNAVCEGQICFLPAAWNFCWHVNENGRVFETLPPSLYRDFHAGEQAPFLIHYASVKKPWHAHEISNWSAYFWETAARTPYAKQLAKAAGKALDEKPSFSSRVAAPKSRHKSASIDHGNS